MKKAQIILQSNYYIKKIQNNPVPELRNDQEL